MRETRVRSLGREDPLEKEMVTHSSILAWRIPWMEKPGRLTLHGVTKSRTRLSNFTYFTLWGVPLWLSWELIFQTYTEQDAFNWPIPFSSRAWQHWIGLQGLRGCRSSASLLTVVGRRLNPGCTRVRSGLELQPPTVLALLHVLSDVAFLACVLLCYLFHSVGFWLLPRSVCRRCRNSSSCAAGHSTCQGAASPEKQAWGWLLPLWIRLHFQAGKNGTEYQCFPGLLESLHERVEWPRQPIPGIGSPRGSGGQE